MIGKTNISLQDKEIQVNNGVLYKYKSDKIIEPISYIKEVSSYNSSINSSVISGNIYDIINISENKYIAIICTGYASSGYHNSYIDLCILQCSEDKQTWTSYTKLRTPIQLLSSKSNVSCYYLGNMGDNLYAFGTPDNFCIVTVNNNDNTLSLHDTITSNIDSDPIMLILDIIHVEQNRVLILQPTSKFVTSSKNYVRAKGLQVSLCEYNNGNLSIINTVIIHDKYVGKITPGIKIGTTTRGVLPTPNSFIKISNKKFLLSYESDSESDLENFYYNIYCGILTINNNDLTLSSPTNLRRANSTNDLPYINAVDNKLFCFTDYYSNRNNYIELRILEFDSNFSTLNISTSWKIVNYASGGGNKILHNPIKITDSKFLFFPQAYLSTTFIDVIDINDFTCTTSGTSEPSGYSRDFLGAVRLTSNEFLALGGYNTSSSGAVTIYAYKGIWDYDNTITFDDGTIQKTGINYRFYSQLFNFNTDGIAILAYTSSNDLLLFNNNSYVTEGTDGDISGIITTKATPSQEGTCYIL